MSADGSMNTQAHERSMKTATPPPLLFVPRLIGNAEIRQQVHGTTAIGGFNAAVAV